MKNLLIPKRRHGLKARQARLAQAAIRPVVSLMCESHGQAYVWMTDRGRSRLIKH